MTIEYVIKEEKSMRKIIIAVLTTLMLAMVVGCTPTTQLIVATCYNGKFEGTLEEETNVISFKGIPYAKAPVGDLRWKAPQDVEASSETIAAKQYSNSAIQYLWFSEDITTEVSEDCLYLNVWTKDLKAKDKAVMVFFHGGSYAWGGSSEPLYDGQYIVSENNDVIVVTVNYRIGIMGFIDFSGIEGGEDFPDSAELGLLDAIQSLKWIKQNIAAFGGNPNNITIFGESAGAGMVSLLLASDYAGTLFNRVIAESGSVKLAYSKEQFKIHGLAELLCEVAGAKNMSDLMKLTTEELIALNELPLDEEETCLNDLYNFPLIGGNVTPENPYEMIAKAKEKGVDFLVGTNLNEQAYWLAEVAGTSLDNLTQDEINDCIEYYNCAVLGHLYDGLYSGCTEEEWESVEQYFAKHESEGYETTCTQLFTELIYRQPAILMAEAHANAKGTGKTYMYLFEKSHSKYDFIGACHASELAYVFHNLNETGFCGEINEDLADYICKAWCNFAKTGDPSTSEVTWKPYDTTNRSTMVIGNDCSTNNVNDPYGEDREILSQISETYNIATEGN